MSPPKPLHSLHASLKGGKPARSLSAGPTEHTACHPVVTPTGCQYDAYFDSNRVFTHRLPGFSLGCCWFIWTDARNDPPEGPLSSNFSWKKKSLIPLQCLVQASEIHQVVQARCFGCTFNRLSKEKHITCLFTLII